MVNQCQVGVMLRNVRFLVAMAEWVRREEGWCGPSALPRLTSRTSKGVFPDGESENAGLLPVSLDERRSAAEALGSVVADGEAVRRAMTRHPMQGQAREAAAMAEAMRLLRGR